MPDINELLRRAIESDCAHSIEAIMTVSDDIPTERLLRLLENNIEDEIRARRVMFVLGRLGAKLAVDPIIKLLPQLGVGGKTTALDALGHIGGAKARRAVIEQLDDRDAHVRQFAVVALSRIGDTASVERLRKVARDETETFIRESARSHFQRLRK